MATLLLVPVRVDALVLSQDQAVASPMADFSRLPYVDANGDVGSSVPYLGASVVSRPFELGDLWLGRGLHLHWTLPASLIRADATGAFPPVPNRWLVVLRGAGSSSPRSFIVESDYLHADEADLPAGAVTVPVPPGDPAVAPRPYRRLGRSLPLADWPPSTEGTGDSLPFGPLTAVAYGEPTFAAYYPNCHGVFGFFDPGFDGSAESELQVELVGFYSDPSLDPLPALLKRFVPPPGTTDLGAALSQAIEEELQWTVPAGADPTDLVGTVCHARLTLSPGAPPSETPAGEIALGNTGVEALSAYVAAKLAEAGGNTSTSAGEMEDQLLSLLLSAQWAHRRVDRGAAFEEARHRKELHATSGGTLWDLRPFQGAPVRASASASPPAARPELPPGLADSLNALNVLQASYDRATDQLASLQEQLFADFCRLQWSSYPEDGAEADYPDIDELRFFIEQGSLRQVEELRAARGTLTISTDETGHVTVTCGAEDAPTSWAARVAVASGALQQSLAASGSPGAPGTLVLTRSPAPRYWAPNDPVVLVTGDAVKATGRLGGAGELSCLAVPSPGALTSGTALLRLLDGIDGAPGLPAPTSWTPPWNPFLLEWEVAYFPVTGLTEPGDGRYTPDGLRGLFTLQEGAVDLAGTTLTYRKAATLYTGRSLLTPHVVPHLVKEVEGYLVGAYCDATGAPRPSAATMADFIASHREALVTPAKYVDAGGKAPTWLSVSFLATLMGAYEMLSEPSFVALSQSLGGFHSALLQARQVRQLPVADPLGFGAARRFAARVAAALTGEDGISRARTLPEPLDDFHPVRAGAMQVSRLRLIDTFGQPRDLAWTSVATARTLATPGFDGLAVAALPPRLCQPVRLSLRWLSANHDHAVEMTSHPATSPICGWLVPNYLDRSVLLYDAEGQSVGLFDALGRWGTLPGSDEQRPIGSIANDHLRTMALWLEAKGAPFLGSFLSTLDGALDAIQPEAAEQHIGLSLLMGRPIALVRVSLGLELQGLPAADQSWTSLRGDLGRARGNGAPGLSGRDSRGFERVRFPVRLGERSQLDDGLVGYWLEDEQGALGDTFQSPESAVAGNGSIVTPTPGEPLNLFLSPREAPLTLSLLLDPRGTVHATAGVVPTQVLSIPPDQYAAALRAIEVSFLSAPLLGPLSAPRVSLPDEPGFSWSWLQRVGTTWQSLPAPTTQGAGAAAPPGPVLRPFPASATFSGPKMLRDGWLVLSRPKAPLGAP